MEPASRLDRAEKNSWLVVVACLHYLHEMVDAELTNNPDVRPVNRPMKARVKTCRKFFLAINNEVIGNL